MEIIQSNLTFKGLEYGNNPRLTIVHHSEATTCTIQDIHSWHLAKGWCGCGYHYFVRKDGTIYKGRPDNAIGSQCMGHNTNTLGICFEGNFMEETMGDTQYNAGLALIKSLGLPVKGHKELFNTDCPGTNFPLEDMKNLVERSTRKYGWNRNNTGWWYCTDVKNGYYYADLDWKKIGDDWYSFDKDGYARTGWLQYNGKWYFLKEEDNSDMCKMAHDETLTIKGTQYSFDSNGAMLD